MQQIEFVAHADNADSLPQQSARTPRVEKPHFKDPATAIVASQDEAPIAYREATALEMW